MSAPGASNGSQAAAASQSVGFSSSNLSTPAIRDLATPATDSATVGNIDVVEVEDDVPVGKKSKIRS